MNLNESLTKVFGQFLKHQTSPESLKGIRDAVGVDDVSRLIGFVESLEDPGAYCEDDFDQRTPAGYFLFIDFVSALIVNLGRSGIEQARQFEKSQHAFVKWVVRFTTDQRFHAEILSKFDQVF